MGVRRIETGVASGAAPADRFGPDPERSYALTARHYYDPGIFRLEREAIFYRAWNLVCHADSLRAPGDYATATIGDQNIVAIRGKDGVLRAFYNVCQHPRSRAASGRGQQEGHHLPLSRLELPRRRPAAQRPG